eukprot:7064399-Ditylum_brightwellii.AAC.1
MDSDSFIIHVGNCTSGCASNDINHFISAIKPIMAITSEPWVGVTSRYRARKPSVGPFKMTMEERIAIGTK